MRASAFASAALVPVLLAALATSAAPGCTAAQTALVIRVDSDMARGTELQSVHVTVVRDIDSVTLLDGTYNLTLPRFPLPGTVVLNAASGIDARAMQVTVEGTVAGAMPITRQFHVRFRPGHVVLLDVYLARRCVPPSAIDCGTDATCGPCNCDPIDPGALIDYDPMGDNPGPNTCNSGASDGGAPDGTPGCVPEVCNGVDDNCNGAIDEDLGFHDCGVGACRRSVPACDHGMPTICTPGTPSREVCNGEDDNCNGVPDEGSCAADQSCIPVLVLSQMQWACCSRVATISQCRAAGCQYCGARSATDPIACCYDPR